MSESNVANSESRDSSPVQFINNKPGSRRYLWFSPESAQFNRANIANTVEKKRKRTGNPDNWDRNIQQYKRTKGLAYTNRAGNLIPAKTFVDVLCGCRLGCNKKIRPDEREAAMKAFYSLHTRFDQNVFLSNCIKVNEIKRRRPTNGTKEQRSHSFKYYFRKDGHYIPVCKKYFRETYQVSDGRIAKSCFEEQFTNSIDEPNNRVARNKIDDTNVIKHIKSFPAYTSRHTRAHNAGRRYLNPDLNIKKMYDLYVSQCKIDNVVPVKEKYYYKVFSSRFNLHFKQPSKDTCQTCDCLETKIQTSDGDGVKIAEIEMDHHLEEAERARSQMAADRMAVSEKIFVFSFALEKALAFPKLSVPVAYYKRNLHVYNFSCHEFNKNMIEMFVWPETEGSNGPQEISSCLIKYLKIHAAMFDKIIAYSDAQNRNIETVLSLLKLIQNTEIKSKSIEMKFLLNGHSYLPNDSDFEIIELHSKKVEKIFSPDDWYNIIKSCKNKMPFRLSQMTHKDFYSTQPLENVIFNKKLTTTGLSVDWHKIQWIKLERSKPHLIQFKYDYSEDSEFSAINISKSNDERLISLRNVDQPLLYPKGRIVPNETKRDIMDLLIFIPPDKQEYYKNLANRNENSSNTTDADIIYISDESNTNNIS